MVSDVCVCSLFKVFFFLILFPSFTSIQLSPSICYFYLTSFPGSLSLSDSHLVVVVEAAPQVFPLEVQSLFFLILSLCSCALFFCWRALLPTRFPIRGSWFAAPFPNAGTGRPWRVNGAQRGSFAGVVCWWCFLQDRIHTNHFPREIGPKGSLFFPSFPLSPITYKSTPSSTLLAPRLNGTIGSLEEE